MSTSSDTTPTGKYLNRLPLPNTIAPTALFPEDNLSVLAADATTTVPLTPLNITVTRNKMSTDFYSSIDHPHHFYSPSPPPKPKPMSPRYAPSPIPFCESPLPMSTQSFVPEITAISQGVQTDYVTIPPMDSYHSGKFELETQFVLEFLANSNILNRSFPTNLGSILQRNPVCGRVCKLPRNLSIVRE